MNLDVLAHCQVHLLGKGCEILETPLPNDLTWDAARFDRIWNLHPAERHKIMIHGRWVETPRWQQAYGADYEYTGNVNEALPIPAELQPLLRWGQQTIYQGLNGKLLNWYEGARDYIGQHHDSVKHLDKEAPIVTISFGETRKFRLTREEKYDGKLVVVEKKDFPAPHGTVFVTPYRTNLAWKHGVPASTRYHGRRISVTLRAFTTGVLATSNAVRVA